MRTALTRSIASAAGAAALFAGAIAIAPEASAASACTKLWTAPGGALVNVCKTWNADGHGAYYGTWKWSSSFSGVKVEGMRDLEIIGSLAKSGSYTQAKVFKMRACRNGSCSNWW
ncbi:hypothetical protein ACQB60_06160 [Actinomycetota bacterium Odt1-20B]